jgi:hypothetical protein
MARTTCVHIACTPPCVRQLVVSVSKGAARSWRWNAADTAANLKLVVPRVMVCAVSPAAVILASPAYASTSSISVGVKSCTSSMKTCDGREPGPPRTAPATTRRCR